LLEYVVIALQHYVSVCYGFVSKIYLVQNLSSSKFI